MICQNYTKINSDLIQYNHIILKLNILLQNEGRISYTSNLRIDCMEVPCISTRFRFLLIMFLHPRKKKSFAILWLCHLSILLQKDFLIAYKILFLIKKPWYIWKTIIVGKLGKSDGLVNTWGTYPFRHFIYFYIHKVEILIKVLIFEHAFSNHLENEEEARASGNFSVPYKFHNINVY